MMRSPVLVVVGLLAVLGCAGAVSAQAIEPLAGTNLALDRPATFSWEPNYPYSKGGDETDLTDGKYWPAGGPSSFWTDPGTVGWSWGGKPGVLIAFDLDKTHTIDAVAFDTYRNEDTLPSAVMVYVSDDGAKWHYVTDLINDVAPMGSRHRFVARDLKTRGRHVAMYMVSGGFYAFVDEIEVLAGDSAPASVTLQGDAVVTDQI